MKMSLLKVNTILLRNPLAYTDQSTCSRKKRQGEPKWSIIKKNSISTRK